jgi:hypothetical protein
MPGPTGVLKLLVTKSFTAEKDDQLSIRKSGVVFSKDSPTVSANGWRFVWKDSKPNPEGWVPDSHLELLGAKSSQAKRKTPTSGQTRPKLPYEEFSLFTDDNGDPIYSEDIGAMQGRKPTAGWTGSEPTWWFFRVRAAPNDRKLLARLTSLAFFHPNMTTYVKTNLKSTRKLWGECHFVWLFSRGVQYSLTAEVWFRSALHHLGTNSVGLAEFHQTVLEIIDKRIAITYNRDKVGVEFFLCYCIPLIFLIRYMHNSFPVHPAMRAMLSVDVH